MKHKHLYQSVVIIGVLALNANANANVKVYPASLCVEESDILPEIEYKWVASGVYAENTAGGGNWWVCPVVRDDENGAVEDWDVVVNRNGNTGASWDITLFNLNKSGTSGFSDTISVPATNGVQRTRWVQCFEHRKWRSTRDINLCACWGAAPLF